MGIAAFEILQNGVVTAIADRMYSLTGGRVLARVVGIDAHPVRITREWVLLSAGWRVLVTGTHSE